MFSLIITIFAIALVVVLIMVTAYYGGPILMGNSAKVAAETLVNQSIQIASARQIAIAQGRAIPSGTAVSLPTDLLRSMPVPPASAYVSGEPSASDWEYYVPGVSSHFGISTKITKKACMEVNKQQGFLGIPAAWDGTSAIQCFGPSPTGYTYLYQPTGTTPQQHDAVLQHAIDVAKPEIPSVTPGYPRLCPNGETINEGVCEGGTVAPKPTGFWIVTAQASDWSTTSLTSEGYSTTCPPGAVDPTSSAATPAPSKAGEPFNVDGLVELGWSFPPNWETFTLPVSRTWCIPANEEDVLDSISTGPKAGGVASISQTVIPSTARTTPDVSPGSQNETALLSAGGKQWAVLASTFYVETINEDNSDDISMLGHKVAIGKVATATESFFVNSPATVYNGISYQNTAGTITFPAPQAPCRPLARTAALGTGGEIVQVVESSYTSMLLKQDGSVWTTGAGWDGLLGNCSYDDRYTWTRVATGATSIGHLPGAYFFVKSDGTLWLTGDATIVGGPYGITKFEQTPVTDVVQAGGIGGYLAIRKPDGTLWQLGNSFADSRPGYTSFTLIASDVEYFEGTFYELYVLKKDHTLWRYPFDGSTATKVADNVGSFSSTTKVLVFVATDGKVYAWGQDADDCKNFGQGASTTRTYSTNTQIASGVGTVAKVLTTERSTRLLSTDGTLWVAGCNDDGAFGDGTTTRHAAFTPMASGVKLFGTRFVVNTAGSLFASGGNDYGQFGNGTTQGSTTFVPVAY